MYLCKVFNRCLCAAVDYLVIRPIKGLMCDMRSCFTKYWRKRSALDVGHRGAGSSNHAAK